MRYLLILLPLLMAAAPSPEHLAEPGGIKCVFFDRTLSNGVGMTLYWRDLVDWETDTFSFKIGDGSTVTVSKKDSNPWICIPFVEESE